ncbi:serine/threonine-protein kinase SBK1-like [Aquarana catesbeiana]|uniref:serine/threonine-protein kinase SBK1-like n=1 Tax=Aquarana catesbeiana TaxID=8400 RepID=UPI003CC92937
MASVDHNVEGLLDRMVYFYAQKLQQIDFEEYFLIKEELGKGGYGNVFLVQDKETAFHSYCLLTKSIIGCFGFFFSTTDYFVFPQELVPVGDRFSMISPNVGIPEDAVKVCAVQISSALEFISEKGLVHMDLKPENVLVFDQDYYCIKITDFGLTKVTGKVIRARCGSKSYMVPEFNLTISDGLVVDGSLDVWVFGVIIYCLVTGEFPWQVAMLDDETYKQYVDWQNDFREVNPPETWKKVPAGIQRIMFIDLLAIDRTKRNKTLEVLKYLSESWKEETPELTLIQEEGDSIERISSVESEATSASHLNTSQSSVSISSSISSLSYLLTTNNSGSQSEIFQEPQKDMSEALIMFHDEFSLHISAEVDIG